MSVGAVNKQTGDRIPTAGMPAIDSVLSGSSTNPVQNRVVKAALDEKADTDIAASDFDATASYTAGNYCIYEGKFYKFKANHSGAWAAADVDEIKIAGELASLKSGLTNLDSEVNGDATVYPYADVITIPDAVPSNLADCSVKIEPVQDLHGYDKPWVGGAGKNIIPMTVAGIKAENTTGTWSGDSYTNNGITWTILTDSNENVIGIKVNGTTSNSISLFVLNNNFIVPESVAAYINGSTANVINKIWLSDWSGGAQSIAGEDKAMTTPSDGILRCRLQVDVNKTVNNEIAYPMIRLSTETDATFAPYTNICPISGHTQASVQRDGKNLFDKDDSGIVANKYLNYQTGELVNSTSNWDTSAYIPVKKFIGEDIVFSGMNIGSSNVDVCYYDSSKNYISGTSSNVMTYTIPSDTRIAYLRFDYKHADAGSIQLELGSSATDYEPYQGKTYTIALGSTIYGGTLDFDSGVMTVTKVFAEFDGSEDEVITKQGSGAGTYFTLKVGTLNIVGERNNTIFNIGQYGEDVNIMHSDYLGYDCVRSYYTFGIDNVSDYKTYLASNPLQVVYELATPTTIQLTPQQIQLLKGTNTLYASTGQISVTANGVAGSIGAVQEQVNDHEERIEAVESAIGALKVYAKWAQSITVPKSLCTFIMFGALSGATLMFTYNAQSDTLTGIDGATGITATVNADDTVTFATSGGYGTFVVYVV